MPASSVDIRSDVPIHKELNPKGKWGITVSHQKASASCDV